MVKVDNSFQGRSASLISDLSAIKHQRFPRPFERLALASIASAADGLVGVEIGVAGGLHADSLINTPGVSLLYLVDPYALDPDDQEGRTYWGVSAPTLNNLKSEARERLKGAADRCTFLEMTSLAASRSNQLPALVDFVYIDGNHSYRAVSEDIGAWWPKVREGGVIGGHDFYNGYTRSHDGVVKAVTEFSVHNDLDLRVELPDWWISKTT